MATLGGAQALGLDRHIGSLASGKAADLCAVRVNDPALLPCYDPASLVVYAAGREHISDVWVSGERRVAGGRLLGMSEIELINLSEMWQNQIRPRNL
jgi:5-methylthioadenosine/S-adenosylhomocysteine deaminase